MARVKLEGGMDPMKPLEGGMDRAKLCEGGMDRAKLCEGGMDPTKPDRSGGRMTRMTAGGIMTWMTGGGERMAGGMRIGGHHDAERKERIEGEEEGDNKINDAVTIDNEEKKESKWDILRDCL